MTQSNRSRLSYKLAFAARHPNQIVPYVRRVCVDAWLRASTRDHVSYYRSVMKYKASKGVRHICRGPTAPQVMLGVWLCYAQPD